MRKITFLIAVIVFTVSTTFGQVFGTINGRVTDKNTGSGIPYVVVAAIPSGCWSGWNGQSALTNPFGFYQMDILFDCTVIVEPFKKQYTFSPGARIINLGFPSNDVDFVGTE